MSALGAADAAGFNPRSRMGSDLVYCQLPPTLICFNPRSRMGSDFPSRALALIERDVSIHAPAWGATYADHPVGAESPRFNPRSRMGSDWDLWGLLSGDLVSIHAPAWGATRKRVAPIIRNLVSIHAPAWGATRRNGHRGEEFVVSIHAPAWGATLYDNGPNP